jgi:PKD repeat protein
VLAALVVVIQSCGESDKVVQSDNAPPAKATMDALTGAPADGAVGQPIRPVLSWTCHDVDGDPLTFDVYLGTSATPPLVASGRATFCMVPELLEYSTTYYWRIVARDDHGHATASDTWSFTTQARSLGCSATGNPEIGLPPLTVTFSGEGLDGKPPYTYFWLFGDDSTSTEQNPRHLYTHPGTYRSVLKVTDSESATCSHTVTTIVEGPPVCDAIADPTLGPPPLTVSFTGIATEGKPPYTHLWSFGDGEVSTDISPTHTYRDPGDFAATYTVTGADYRSCSRTIVITIGPPLTCSASASTANGQVPLTVNFIATASGGRGPYSYYWVFGDGGASSSQDASHTYTRTGQYPAILSVTDSGNRTCSKTLYIVVWDFP